MSLLLEALKKAELAKQMAKAEAPAPESTPGEQAAPLMTREKLPDISQPLEILADDLPTEHAARAAPHERATPAPTAQPAASENETTRLAERAQAQQLFQVKEMDYNPRRPFYLTVSALGLIGVCYGGYVWWQMQPKYGYTTAQAQSSPVETPTAPVTPPPAAAAPAPTPATPTPTPAPTTATATARTAIAEIPPIQPVRPPRPRIQTGAPIPRPPRARPELPAEPARPAPRPGETFAPIAISAPTPAVDPTLERAYESLQRNDLVAAREGYQRVLAREPTSRDALLGLAAIDVRTGQLESAESRYLRLLDTDPRDTHALANLLALRGQLDPLAAESRLKNLLANQPESAPLHFSLGNQYAQQSRWSEAQGAYFKAYSVDPENADYAFNLAISLDQLHQRNLALDYYQRALALAGKRTASFNPAQARTRVQELSR